MIIINQITEEELKKIPKEELNNYYIISELDECEPQMGLASTFTNDSSTGIYNADFEIKTLYDIYKYYKEIFDNDDCENEFKIIDLKTNKYIIYLTDKL